MRLIPARYFSEKYLQPLSPPSLEISPVLPEHILQRAQAFAVELRDRSYVTLSSQDLERHPDLAVFIAVIHAIGAARVVRRDDRLQVSSVGPLASDVAHVLSFFLRYGFPMFDDWTRRFRTIPDRLCGLELLHHMELQRIEYSRRAGIRPEVFHIVPVAFAVIKAYSGKRRRDVYLLELNKDWNRYNLIGGKQEPQDTEDYRRILLREIEEELGVPRREVQLTPLSEEPLEGYSLSGHRGVLTRYPCMLFLARFASAIPTRAKDKWFTEEDLRRLQDSEEPGLMINSVYLDFLFNKLPGRLKGLDYSFKDPLDYEPWYEALTALLARHKGWLIPVLAVLAALIALIRAILS